MTSGYISDPYAGLTGDFMQGMARFQNGEYATALKFFEKAEEFPGTDDNKFTCQSFIGLTRIILGDPEGIKQCRTAAHFEHYDADVYYNLAVAELKVRDRRRAVDAIRAGLVIERDHRGLNKLRRKIGQRRAPVLRFLSRDHALNKMLGRLTYRLAHR